MSCCQCRYGSLLALDDASCFSNSFGSRFRDTVIFGGRRSPLTFAGCGGLLLIRDDLLKLRLSLRSLSMCLRPKNSDQGIARAFRRRLHLGCLNGLRRLNLLTGSRRLLAIVGYCQVGEGSGVWQGLGHEHNVQSVPRLPLSG